MSNVPRPAPSWGTVAAAQLRMVALLQRRDFIVFGAIGLGLAALSLYGLTVVEPRAPDAQPQDALDIFRGLGTIMVVVGMLWPLGVWRQDAPERRGYFWSLPVPRGPHTLLRAGAGWLLLMGAALAAMAVGALIAHLYAVRLGTVVRYSDWYLPLTAATLSYLIISVFAVLVDNPVRWVVWIVVAVFGLSIISQTLEIEALWRAIGKVYYSLAFALGGAQPVRFGDSSRWILHYLLWSGLALAALVAGAYRHRDAR